MMNATHAIGWKAKDFALQGTDGRTYSLADIRGPKGMLVVFICNHCPYVKASINRIVTEANALREIWRRNHRHYAKRYGELSRGLL